MKIFPILLVCVALVGFQLSAKFLSVGPFANTISQDYVGGTLCTHTDVDSVACPEQVIGSGLCAETFHTLTSFAGNDLDVALGEIDEDICEGDDCNGSGDYHTLLDADINTCTRVIAN